MSISRQVKNMKVCYLGHEYLFTCKDCEYIDKVLQSEQFKKIDHILTEYAKTGNKICLESLSNGQV